jgi:uncharacterized membrane protein YcaP (DUF421 family)
MIQEIYQGFQDLIGAGSEPRDYTFFQISLRGLIVFCLSLVMVRLADKRFFAKKSAFDVILGFILASMLARAVNGSSAFFPTIGGGFVLIGLHRLLASLAFRSHKFGNLVKGKADLLVENGKMKVEAMRENNITEHDLLEDLRLNGQVDDPKDVKVSRFERSGEISVVPKSAH